MVATVTFEFFQAELAHLVSRFEREHPHFTDTDYNEAMVRADFLDPFFRSLGWDVGNAKGLIHTEREVDIEVRTALSGRQTRADYVFRVARVERFTCEAKKPAETLHAGHIYQAKRDAFARGIPLAILSDFEDLNIYIVGARPRLSEPGVGEYKKLNFRQYLGAARELWDLLAYEHVAAGAIDKVIDSLPKRALKVRGRQGYLIKPDRTKSLDADFLNFLDEARRALGSDLLKYNDREDLLTGHRLNEAAQRIIDRLVFLRICEDRGIDTGGLLDSLLNGWLRQQRTPPKLRRQTGQGRLSLKDESVHDDPGAYSASRAEPAEGGLYRELVEHIRSLDQRPPSYKPFFNGQLFKPHFSEELIVGDEFLANFIDDLTDDESGYNFADIKVEILGSAYERFLGNVLLPQGRGVKIEEKPEVRKAGGVYYTPRYIVDYIVENTVGRLLRTADSGQRTADSGQRTADSGQRTADSGQLLPPSKVAKLRFLDPACGSGSFLLRVYERVMEHYLRWFMENPAKQNKADCYLDAVGNVRLTTQLKRRILQENVYGVDLDTQAVEVTQLSLYLKMLEGENRESIRAQTELFNKEPLLPALDKNILCGNSLIASGFSLDPAELIRVNAFDWDVGFEKIMNAGGFDAVVGNPPWIDLKGFDPTQITYFFGHYDTSENRMNVYSTFMHRSMDLLKSNGYYGVITPSSFLTQSSYTKLRQRLASFQICTIIRTPDDVFDGVTAETAISLFRKQPPASSVSVLIYPPRARLSAIGESGWNFANSIDQSKWLESGGIFNLRSDVRVSGLLDKIQKTGQTLESVCEFCLGLTPYDKAKGHSPSEIEDRVYHATKPKGNAWKPILEGSDICRYSVKWGGAEYIKYGPWLGAPRDSRFFTEPRLLVRQIISGRPPRIYVGYTEEELYNSQVAFNLLPRSGGKLTLKALLGILGSSLMTWYHRQRFLDLNKTTFQKILIQDAKNFPIPILLESKNKPSAPIASLIQKVDRMLSLVSASRTAKIDAERAALQNAIRKTDRDIDQLVYQLYGLTPEEIALIEGTATPVETAE